MTNHFHFLIEMGSVSLSLEGNVVVTEPSRKAVDKLKADLVDIVVITTPA